MCSLSYTWAANNSQKFNDTFATDLSLGIPTIVRLYAFLGSRPKGNSVAIEAVVNLLNQQSRTEFLIVDPE